MMRGRVKFQCDSIMFGVWVQVRCGERVMC